MHIGPVLMPGGKSSSNSASSPNTTHIVMEFERWPTHVPADDAEITGLFVDRDVNPHIVSHTLTPFHDFTAYPGTYYADGTKKPKFGIYGDVLFDAPGTYTVLIQVYGKYSDVAANPTVHTLQVTVDAVDRNPEAVPFVLESLTIPEVYETSPVPLSIVTSGFNKVVKWEIAVNGVMQKFLLGNNWLDSWPTPPTQVYIPLDTQSTIVVTGKDKLGAIVVNQTRQSYATQTLPRMSFNILDSNLLSPEIFWSDVNIVEYFLSEDGNATPIFSPTKPTNFTFSNSGVHYIFGWGKDRFGKILQHQEMCTVNNIAPTIDEFTIATTCDSLTVPLTFKATAGLQNTPYIYYVLSENPEGTSAQGSFTSPTSYTFKSYGTKTLYAWVNDSFRNKSNVITTTITLALGVLNFDEYVLLDTGVWVKTGNTVVGDANTFHFDSPTLAIYDPAIRSNAPSIGQLILVPASPSNPDSVIATNAPVPYHPPMQITPTTGVTKYFVYTSDGDGTWRQKFNLDWSYTVLAQPLANNVATVAELPKGVLAGYEYSVPTTTSASITLPVPVTRYYVKERTAIMSKNVTGYGTSTGGATLMAQTMWYGVYQYKLNADGTRFVVNAPYSTQYALVTSSADASKIALNYTEAFLDYVSQPEQSTPIWVTKWHAYESMGGLWLPVQTLTRPGLPTGGTLVGNIVVFDAPFTNNALTVQELPTNVAKGYFYSVPFQDAAAPGTLVGKTISGTTITADKLVTTTTVTTTPAGGGTPVVTTSSNVQTAIPSKIMEYGNSISYLSGDVVKYSIGLGQYGYFLKLDNSPMGTTPISGSAWAQLTDKGSYATNSWYTKYDMVTLATTGELFYVASTAGTSIQYPLGAPPRDAHWVSLGGSNGILPQAPTVTSVTNPDGSTTVTEVTTTRDLTTDSTPVVEPVTKWHIYVSVGVGWIPKQNPDCSLVVIDAPLSNNALTVDALPKNVASGYQYSVPFTSTVLKAPGGAAVSSIISPATGGTAITGIHSAGGFSGGNAGSTAASGASGIPGFNPSDYTSVVDWSKTKGGGTQELPVPPTGFTAGTEIASSTGTIVSTEAGFEPNAEVLQTIGPDGLIPGQKITIIVNDVEEIYTVPPSGLVPAGTKIKTTTGFITVEASYDVTVGADGLLPDGIIKVKSTSISNGTENPNTVIFTPTGTVITDAYGKLPAGTVITTGHAAEGTYGASAITYTGTATVDANGLIPVGTEYVFEYITMVLQQPSFRALRAGVEVLTPTGSVTSDAEGKLPPGTKVRTDGYNGVGSATVDIPVGTQLITFVNADGSLPEGMIVTVTLLASLGELIDGTLYIYRYASADTALVGERLIVNEIFIGIITGVGTDTVTSTGTMSIPGVWRVVTAANTGRVVLARSSEISVSNYSAFPYINLAAVTDPAYGFEYPINGLPLDWNYSNGGVQPVLNKAVRYPLGGNFATMFSHDNLNGGQEVIESITIPQWAKHAHADLVAYDFYLSGKRGVNTNQSIVVKITRNATSDADCQSGNWMTGLVVKIDYATFKSANVSMSSDYNTIVNAPLVLAGSYGSMNYPGSLSAPSHTTNTANKNLSNYFVQQWAQRFREPEVYTGLYPEGSVVVATTGDNLTFAEGMVYMKEEAGKSVITCDILLSDDDGYLVSGVHTLTSDGAKILVLNSGMLPVGTVAYAKNMLLVEDQYGLEPRGTYTVPQDGSLPWWMEFDARVEGSGDLSVPMQATSENKAQPLARLVTSQGIYIVPVSGEVPPGTELVTIGVVPAGTVLCTPTGEYVVPPTAIIAPGTELLTDGANITIPASYYPVLRHSAGNAAVSPPLTLIQKKPTVVSATGYLPANLEMFTELATETTSDKGLLTPGTKVQTTQGLVTVASGGTLPIGTVVATSLGPIPVNSAGKFDTRTDYARVLESKLIPADGNLGTNAAIITPDGFFIKSSPFGDLGHRGIPNAVNTPNIPAGDVIMRAEQVPTVARIVPGMPVLTQLGWSIADSIGNAHMQSASGFGIETFILTLDTQEHIWPDLQGLARPGLVFYTTDGKLAEVKDYSTPGTIIRAEDGAIIIVGSDPGLTPMLVGKTYLGAIPANFILVTKTGIVITDINSNIPAGLELLTTLGYVVTVDGTVNPSLTYIIPDYFATTLLPDSIVITTEGKVTADNAGHLPDGTVTTSPILFKAATTDGTLTTDHVLITADNTVYEQVTPGVVPDALVIVTAQGNVNTVGGKFLPNTLVAVLPPLTNTGARTGRIPAPCVLATKTGSISVWDYGFGFGIYPVGLDLVTKDGSTVKVDNYGGVPVGTIFQGFTTVDIATSTGLLPAGKLVNTLTGTVIVDGNGLLPANIQVITVGGLLAIPANGILPPNTIVAVVHAQSSMAADSNGLLPPGTQIIAHTAGIVTVDADGKLVADAGKVIITRFLETVGADGKLSPFSRVSSGLPDIVAQEMNTVTIDASGKLPLFAQAIVQSLPKDNTGAPMYIAVTDFTAGQLVSTPYGLVRVSSLGTVPEGTEVEIKFQKTATVPIDGKLPAGTAVIKVDFESLLNGRFTAGNYYVTDKGILMAGNTGLLPAGTVVRTLTGTVTVTANGLVPGGSDVLRPKELLIVPESGLLPVGALILTTTGASLIAAGGLLPVGKKILITTNTLVTDAQGKLPAGTVVQVYQTANSIRYFSATEAYTAGRVVSYNNVFYLKAADSAAGIIPGSSVIWTPLLDRLVYTKGEFYNKYDVVLDPATNTTYYANSTGTLGIPGIDSAWISLGGSREGTVTVDANGLLPVNTWVRTIAGIVMVYEDGLLPPNTIVVQLAIEPGAKPATVLDTRATVIVLPTGLLPDGTMVVIKETITTNADGLALSPNLVVFTSTGTATTDQYGRLPAGTVVTTPTGTITVDSNGLLPSSTAILVEGLRVVRPAVPLSPGTIVITPTGTLTVDAGGLLPAGEAVITKGNADVTGAGTGGSVIETGTGTVTPTYVSNAIAVVYETGKVRPNAILLTTTGSVIASAIGEIPTNVTYLVQGGMTLSGVLPPGTILQSYIPTNTNVTLPLYGKLDTLESIWTTTGLLPVTNLFNNVILPVGTSVVTPTGIAVVNEYGMLPLGTVVVTATGTTVITDFNSYTVTATGLVPVTVKVITTVGVTPGDMLQAGNVVLTPTGSTVVPADGKLPDGTVVIVVGTTPVATRSMNILATATVLEESFQARPTTKTCRVLTCASHKVTDVVSSILNKFSSTTVTVTGSLLELIAPTIVISTNPSTQMAPTIAIDTVVQTNAGPHVQGTTIQFKRGNKIDLPVSAAVGEPLVTLDTAELYVGTGTGLRKISDVTVSTTEPLEADRSKLWYNPDTNTTYIYKDNIWQITGSEASVDYGGF